MGVILQVVETDGSVVNLSTPSNVVQVTSSPVAIKTVVNSTQPLITLKSIAGLPGLSAYEIAVANGFVGTQQEWLNSLKGVPGDIGSIDLSAYYTMSDVDYLVNAREPSIAAGAITQYFRGDKTWQTLDKTAVGLSFVDNTSDANKPVSTAQQTALNAKENTIAAGTLGQYLRGDKTWATLDKIAVGLPNVDNTSDANKPISTATQTALNAKATDTAVVHLASAETISGVKTFSASPIVPTPTLDTQAANKAYVDSKGTGGGTWGSITGVLANQTDLNTALSGKEATIAAGTTSQWWRGDKTWQALTKTSVGLANVDNTSDVNKPVSTAQQTALNAKGDKTILAAFRYRSDVNEASPTATNYDVRPTGYKTVISVGALPAPSDMQAGDIHWEIVP